MFCKAVTSDGQNNKKTLIQEKNLNKIKQYYDRAGLARISTPVGDTVRPELFFKKENFGKENGKNIKARVNEPGTIFRNST